MGYRRRHIRSRSGDTEAEFDTALDAAIEAAYDDGYEPVEAEDLRQVDSGEEIVANALRKVELARQRVRQAEREAYEMATEQERERFQLQPQRNYAKQQNMSLNTEDFFDDNSSEEEERMLEQMTRDYAVHDFQEPCPTDFMLRPFWFMRCLYQTLVHPRGGYLSPKLFVPRDAWRVKGVKLKNVEDKIANCDFLTAALLKLSRVDTCDADAMLEEMQSMEGVLEQTQISLSRKLGNEVGVQSTSNLFKDASAGTDGDTSSSLPRTASVSNKASFSWRRLRSKNSAATLAPQGRGGATDPTKDTQGLTTLPMTTQPTSKPAKRDISQVQFTGPNANYMGSLARLFDAAQVIDQIARQVEDPGLRHADKTQVGLELCTRHAAEFFGFYICRFVLTDLGMLMDKFIKRGSEWALV
ncbi:hypothetical protein ACO1O0_006094 [Amphichorda felina]